MRRSFCRVKIYNATVTRLQVDYEGSCGIDKNILEASGIAPFEWVLVINTTNAQRFETYAIPEKAGSGEIALYGGAAKLAEKGDALIVLCLCDLDESELKKFKGPRVLRLKPGNKLPS
jgi:aspartate 1-decarboxylase